MNRYFRMLQKRTTNILMIEFKVLDVSSIIGFGPTFRHRKIALREPILRHRIIALWFFTKIFQFEAPASIKTFSTSSGASYDGAPANKIFDFHHVHILELPTNQMYLKLNRKWTGSQPETIQNA